MATFYNLATLSYNGVSKTSNITTGEILDILAVSKKALSSTYKQGENVVYTVGMVNSGATALNSLTFSDDLGAYTVTAGIATPLTYKNGTLKYYINGILQPTPTLISESPLTVSGISIPAGGNGVLVYDTIVNEFAPLGENSTINNTITLTGDALLSPVTASDTVTASSEPQLGILKSLSPTTVSGNGQITYTFLIENRGNTAADANDNVQVSDTFTPILKDINVSFNGVAWTLGTQYQYDESTGVFTTIAGDITVPSATFASDEASGKVSVTPGVSVLTVSGNIG